jgi:hypothetical protein
VYTYENHNLYDEIAIDTSLDIVNERCFDEKHDISKEMNTVDNYDVGIEESMIEDHGIGNKMNAAENNRARENDNTQVPILSKFDINDQCNVEQQNDSFGDTFDDLCNEVNDNNFNYAHKVYDSNIASINVCGLKSKLLCPDFNDSILSYDIIGMVETKLKEFDINMINDQLEESIPGYFCLHKPRKYHNGTASGGISIMIKNSFKEKVNVIETDNDNILWCKIHGFLAEPNEHLLLGVVYISPEGSQYSNAQCFNDIESDYFTHFIDMKRCVIVGDFNSYINNKLDFYNDGDDETPFDTDIDNEQDLSLNVKNALENFDLPLIRETKCKHRTNNWGNKFLDLIKGINFFILNGRYGEKSGVCTTTHESIIDFAIASVEMMPHITDFNIKQFCPMVSDCHLPIYIKISNIPKDLSEQSAQTLDEGQPVNIHDMNMSLDCNVQLCDERTITNTDTHFSSKAKQWDENRAEDFTASIDRDKIDEVEILMNGVDNCNDIQQLVDKVSEEVQEIFDKAGRTAFGTKTITNKPRRKKAEIIAGRRWGRKPYFNMNCENKRTIFHQSKTLYHNTKDNEHFKDMKTKSKEYKKELNKAYNEYAQGLRNKVKTLRHSGKIKDYWKFVNEEHDNNDKDDDTDNIRKFYELFKNINTDEEANSTSGEAHSGDTSQQPNEELDKPITENEIKASIAKLKNNKASGIDLISNEYIKSTHNSMIKIYVKLFNIVYSTGHVPQSWTIGNIKPIYKKKGSKDNPDNYRPITILSCLGKLFTSVLNSRLNAYAEKHNVIGQEQLGFRKNYSTIDGAFILHALTTIMNKRNKTIYTAFIDLRKAFPSIPRNLLFQKLSNINIGTKMFNVISSMYANIKSCVTLNGKTSDFFQLSNWSEGRRKSKPYIVLFLH